MRTCLSIALLLAAVLFAEARAQALLQHPKLNSPSSGMSIDGTKDNLIVQGPISNRAFVYLKAKWPTDVDLITRVPVCWENPKPEHSKQREMVKSAVSNTWELLSLIRFQNWGPCTPADTGAIHIAVGDYWPQSFIGIDTRGKPAGMKLNFDFQAPNEWTNCKPIAASCIVKTAVHEFGHALAFLHEQTRPDTPDECLAAQPGEQKVPGGAPGYTIVGTPWDLDSVMNYCNPVWNNAGHLSSGDVLALQTVYGAPRQ